MKMIDKVQESKQDINIETYLKKKKTNRENTEETEIIICLQKKQRLKEYQKITVRLKSLNLIINI